MKDKLCPIVAKWRELKKIVTKWKGVKNSGQIKARNIEIPYFGGFRLTDYYPGIEDYFRVSCEIAWYGNIDEAVLLILYFLDNEAQHKLIVIKSHEIAFRQHGYL